MACFVKPAVFDAWTIKEAIYVRLLTVQQVYLNYFEFLHIAKAFNLIVTLKSCSTGLVV